MISIVFVGTGEYHMNKAQEMMHNAVEKILEMEDKTSDVTESAKDMSCKKAQMAKQGAEYAKDETYDKAKMVKDAVGSLFLPGKVTIPFSSVLEKFTPKRKWQKTRQDM